MESVPPGVRRRECLSLDIDLNEFCINQQAMD